MKRLINSKLKVTLTIFFLAAFLTSCTAPITFSQSKPVPPDRLDLEFAKYKNPSDESGKVVVVRDSRFLARLASIHLLVNGKRIGRLKNAESLVFYLPEGTHIISVDLKGLTGDSRPPREQELRVVKGEEYSYRLSYDSQRGVNLERSFLVK